MYAKCLGPDIEYKTVSVQETISSRDLVLVLLSKYRNILYIYLKDRGSIQVVTHKRPLLRMMYET